MNIVVFIGPTLSEREVRKILPDALILGPAEQGDIAFARRQLGADIIAMVDGKHTLCLPPWHKEILQVIEDGARFIGAASMGALRAVECAKFGAEPIGEIAGMYQRHELVADDEVCLIHSDRASGYKKLSVPLVNIRATLRNAAVSQATKNDIMDCAIGMYYPDREWSAIFDACEMGDPDREAVLANEIDLKAADALHLCHYIASGKLRESIAEMPRHSHEGYGHVFDINDVKIMKGDTGTIRPYEISSKATEFEIANARNRALAIELCEMMGIVPRNAVSAVDALPVDDLSDSERIIICNQERALQRAGEWLSCRAAGFADAQIINDYLRIAGRYEMMKQEVKTNG